MLFILCRLFTFGENGVITKDKGENVVITKDKGENGIITKDKA